MLIVLGLGLSALSASAQRKCAQRSKQQRIIYESRHDPTLRFLVLRNERLCRQQ